MHFQVPKQLSRLDAASHQRLWVHFSGSIWHRHSDTATWLLLGSAAWAMSSWHFSGFREQFLQTLCTLKVLSQEWRLNIADPGFRRRDHSSRCRCHQWPLSSDIAWLPNWNGGHRNTISTCWVIVTSEHHRSSTTPGWPKSLQALRKPKP